MGCEPRARELRPILPGGASARGFGRLVLPLQVDEQDRDRRGREPRDACRLAECRRPLLRKLLPHLVRKAAHLRVVERLRQPGSFTAPLALDLVLKNMHGRLVVLKNGRYDNIPVDIVTSTKKTVNVERFYNVDRLRPKFESFEMTPLFIMTSDAI